MATYADMYSKAAQVRAQKLARWQEWEQQVRDIITTAQESVYEPARELCPMCGAQVHGRSAGMGTKWECPCGWTYFTAKYRRTREVEYGESEDGMRPAGSYDVVYDHVVESGGPAPVMVPERTNAAYRLRGRSGKYAILNTAMIARMPAQAARPGRADCLELEEAIRKINSIPRPPAIPEGMDPDELFAWAQAQVASLPQ